MKTLYTCALILFFIATLSTPLDALAQTSGQATSSKAGAGFSDGEVRTIYKNDGKVTIKHGEIKNLGMSAMTMVFLVNDKSLLDKIKVGDKIRFKAISKNGEFVVTEIQGVK
jgi:Cu(I)/Ag(I) efflux system protein CusF